MLPILAASFAIVFPNLIFKQIVEETDKKGTTTLVCHWWLSVISLDVAIALLDRAQVSRGVYEALGAIWILNLLFGRRFHLNVKTMPGKLTITTPIAILMLLATVVIVSFDLASRG